MVNLKKEIEMKKLFDQPITKGEKILAYSVLYQRETNDLKKKIILEKIRKLEENS